MHELTSSLFIGIGATVVMDLWGLARRPLLGIAPPDYGLVGRWLANLGAGRYRPAAIATLAPRSCELSLGWTAHYLIGIGFAAVLVLGTGPAWLAEPRLGPALAVGLGTTLAPFLIMQPGMGAGIAAARTPRPWAARAQTLLTHAVFGVGLYLAALMLRLFSAP